MTTNNDGYTVKPAVAPVTVDPKTGEQTAKPSPKVIAGFVTSLALTAIVAGIAAVTPDHFAALGIWGPVLYAAIVAVGGNLAAYIKRPAS